MPKPTKDSGSPSKQPPFVPPPVGQAPLNYKPTVHTNVRATDFGEIIDAEWINFSQFDPKTGVRTGQLPYWFTCTCVVRNGKGTVRSVRLRNIAAQARQGTLRVRVSGAKNPVVLLSHKKSGDRGVPVRPVDGFYPIEPSCNKDGSPSTNFYTLSFGGPICFLECYITLLHPKHHCGPTEFISDGFPPPGTPPQ